MIDAIESAKAMVNDGAVTVREAAKFSGLSRSHLYQLLEQGRLAFIRPPGTRIRRIPRRALIDFLAGCTHLPEK